ncbi:hypothetical protein [Ruminococcus albus]|uniref:Uncharacterized protein n=1 Tax=Ruminococcus albus TaxID=1264 RepID=A0A1H7MC57_RUMAL|nr:hypothetical protein [Ruminococcus albus]SEL08508.1 hypothetical protein SAMN05216469_11160 [Ruminococcus albus]
MTSIEAKKIISHAMELSFGFAPAHSKIVLSYFSDDEDNNGSLQIDIDFRICDTEYGLIYHRGEYQLTRKDFYGYGHDLIMTFLNE